MIEVVRRMLVGQFEAGLGMMRGCLEGCPGECWDGKIAKYAFWHVGYHGLCFVDYYLSSEEGAFVARGIHPAGLKELEEEYPSRRFERGELVEYVRVCREKAVEAIGRETMESLAGPSGFSRLAFSRGELHVYNVRHLQHHVGQLSAQLRRVGVEVGWVKTGRNCE